MVEFLKIKKEKLPEFINVLIEKYKGYGPKRVGQDLLFEELNDGNEFMDEKTLLSPKDIIYPQVDEILKIEKKDHDFYVDFKVEHEKKIVLGVKACDIRAFQRLDEVLENDIFFKTRHNNTILIPFSCVKACNSGFCKDYGGPTLSNGFHLQFTDIGEYYLVEVSTDVGKKLVSLRDDLFEKANSDDIKRKEDIIKSVLNDLPNIKIQGVHEILDWNDPIIEEFADKCISCGACNYVCPSCFCYNVADMVYDRSVSRIRDWDSCLLAGFTRLAGGENPRGEMISRMRQRLFHKFKYHYERYGTYQCTACGRCFEVCPVEIDLRDFLKHVWGGKKI